MTQVLPDRNRRLLRLFLALLVLLAPLSAGAQGAKKTRHKKAPPAPTSAPASPGAQPSPPPGIVTDAKLEQELGQLEEAISSLRKRILDTKARLLQFGEMISQGTTVGTKLTVFQVNRLPQNFRMTSAAYLLDGYQIFQANEADKTLKGTDFRVYENQMAPGNHTLEVHLEYLAGGGLFKSGQKVVVSSNYLFTVERGVTTTIRATVVDKGKGDVTERPDLQFKAESVRTFSETK